jgi:hypothetical protein
LTKFLYRVPVPRLASGKISRRLQAMKCWPAVRLDCYFFGAAFSSATLGAAGLVK